MNLSKATMDYIIYEIREYNNTVIKYENAINQYISGLSAPSEPIRLLDKRVERLKNTITGIKAIYDKLDGESLMFWKMFFWGNERSLKSVANALGITDKAAANIKRAIVYEVANELGY